jgi:hypothetical protein
MDWNVSYSATDSNPRDLPCVEQTQVTRSALPGGALSDGVFLVLVVWSSLILYIPGLGFYSDDWNYLRNLATAPDQSLSGLFAGLYNDHTAMRPVGTAYFPALFSLFHFQPLGYHAGNAVAFTITVALLYLTLRELGIRRSLSLGATLVYALMPNYSSNRFWIVAFEIHASMLLYFLGLYIAMKAMHEKGVLRYTYLLVSILANISGALSYELVMPLVLLTPLVVWIHWRSSHPAAIVHQRTASSMTAFSVCNTIALAGVTWFKLHSTTRTVLPDDYVLYLFNLARYSIMVNYGWYVVAIPRVVWTTVHSYPNATVLAMSLVVVVVSTWYLERACRASSPPSRSETGAIMLVGLVVYALGYAIFLTNGNVGFTPTGPLNRTAMAASVGVALTVAGGVAWGASFLRSDSVRRLCFCILISLVAGSGLLINNTISAFWVAASQEQHRVLDTIRSDFPTWPAGTTLILDGECPYIGPAVVFEAPYDLAGALTLAYHDASVQADVVRPNFEVRDDGLATVWYGAMHLYPYGRLIILNVERGLTVPIPDRETADWYFRTVNPDRGGSCPGAGAEGYGARIF